MILHYANLCVVAGGVDLFLIGSELRGLEAIRGPGWTKAGRRTAADFAVWDYPFVAGLIQLAADVRAMFDGAGLTKNLTTWENLISYSADWSTWNGVQHSGANGQWPHLDRLFASSNIDLVSFDNYLPLSDWTTGGGGLDCVNGRRRAGHMAAALRRDERPRPVRDADPSQRALFAANIEGGEGFNWFYNDFEQSRARPRSARLGQYGELAGRRPRSARRAIRFMPISSFLAASNSAGGGTTRIRRSMTPATASDGRRMARRRNGSAKSKPLIFVEYGFATVDRCTNQPNVFFDPKSTESYSPFWSAWNSADGATFLPRRDDLLAALALQAIYDYWTPAATTTTSSGGVPMILTPFCCAWNWDARPFPTFPLNASAWGDGGNWASRQLDRRQGTLFAAAPAADAPPGAGSYRRFPGADRAGVERPLFAAVLDEDRRRKFPGARRAPA